MTRDPVRPTAGQRAGPPRNSDSEPFPSPPPPPFLYQAAVAACQRAGFLPRVEHEANEASTLVAMVAAGLGVALVPASARHLRINGVTHRSIRAPFTTTVPLALAYRAGPISPLIRGYIETARTVLLRQKAVPADPNLSDGPVTQPDSI